MMKQMRLALAAALAISAVPGCGGGGGGDDEDSGGTTWTSSSGGGSPPPPPPPTSYADAYEYNNTMASATGLSGVLSGATLWMTIWDSGDVDYVRVDGYAGWTITATLDYLPHDYDLEILNASGYPVAQSTAGGTASETCTYAPASNGTYYIRVWGYAGAYGSSTYRLRIWN